MGDILHTLPALTDARQYYSNIEFDWLIEEDFAEIPTWHEGVSTVIPIALRRWKKNIWRSVFSKSVRTTIKQLRLSSYDFIIDAQGLTKSALFARLAKGKRYGLDRRSARDPSAFIHYHKTYSISWRQHAVARLRQLFAAILEYPVPVGPPKYGINKANLMTSIHELSYLVFVVNTTWETKLWPERFWRELTLKAESLGYPIYITSGNDDEFARAQRISADIDYATALPRQTITSLAGLLKSATAIVSIDTGLSHLAAALNKPTISIYGATDPKMTGTYGVNQIHMQSDYACAPCQHKHCQLLTTENLDPPCYARVSPQQVWQELHTIINQVRVNLCA